MPTNRNMNVQTIDQESGVAINDPVARARQAQDNILLEAAKRQGIDPYTANGSLQFAEFYTRYSQHPELLAQDGLIDQAALDNWNTATGVIEQSYDPSRGVYDSVTNRIINPGVTLDQAAYQQTDQERADVQALRDLRDQPLDANRFEVDPNSVPDVYSRDVTYGRAQTNTADIAQTNQGRAYYTGTQAALDQATAQNTAAGSNAYQDAAGNYLLGAAAGDAPSAAEVLYRQAGAQAAREYQQANLESEIKTRQGANAISAAQAALAAGTRGNVQGLAALNAQNNAAVGQAQLYQQQLDDLGRRKNEITLATQTARNAAAATRADEMAQARQALGAFAGQTRSQDYLGASQQAQIAGQQANVDQGVLANSQFNVGQENQGNQFNAGQQNEQERFNAQQGAAVAAQNADRNLTAQQLNQATNTTIAQGNQSTAANVNSNDLTRQAQIADSTVSANQADQNNRIRYEEEYGHQISQNQDRMANERVGQATVSENRRQFDANRTDRMIGAGIGAAGAVIGAAVASDPKSKNVDRREAPADFTEVKDYRYSYKPEYQHMSGADSREHVGPMADDLPDDVVYTAEGVRKVDTGRLAMRLAAAVGKLQREQRRAD